MTRTAVISARLKQQLEQFLHGHHPLRTTKDMGDNGINVRSNCSSSGDAACSFFDPVWTVQPSAVGEVRKAYVGPQEIAIMWKGCCKKPHYSILSQSSHADMTCSCPLCVDQHHDIQVCVSDTWCMKEGQGGLE